MNDNWLDFTSAIWNLPSVPAVLGPYFSSWYHRSKAFEQFGAGMHQHNLFLQDDYLYFSTDRLLLTYFCCYLNITQHVSLQRVANSSINSNFTKLLSVDWYQLAILILVYDKLDWKNPHSYFKKLKSWQSLANSTHYNKQLHSRRQTRTNRKWMSHYPSRKCAHFAVVALLSALDDIFMFSWVELKRCNTLPLETSNALRGSPKRPPILFGCKKDHLSANL